MLKFPYDTFPDAFTDIFTNDLPTVNSKWANDAFSDAFTIVNNGWVGDVFHDAFPSIVGDSCTTSI